MKQKLIDQLIHRAGARFGGDGINYDGFVPSKFAELIVQECISVINTEAGEREDDDEYERAWKMGTEFAVYQIKQHFGVEE